MTTIFTLFAVSFLFWGIVGILGKNCNEKMQIALLQENDKEFEQLESSFIRKISVSYTKVIFLLLDYAISKDNYKKMNALYERIMQVNITKNNKRKIYPAMFQYYLEKNDQNKCKSLLNEMKNLFSETQFKEMQIVYEINVEKKSDYIEDMLKQSEEVEPQEKGILYYLIAKQYGNKKENANRKKYLNKSFEYLKDTPYGKVIQYEINH